LPPKAICTVLRPGMALRNESLPQLDARQGIGSPPRRTGSLHALSSRKTLMMSIGFIALILRRDGSPSGGTANTTYVAHNVVADG
jgi:hypothetical protein